jgi:hypothetical protein
MDEEVHINKNSLNILNIYDYNITYFQCHHVVLHAVLSFCLER